MYLPAEWHRQAFVQLTWPHPDTDWAPMLDEVLDCYNHMAREIAKRQPLLIVAGDPRLVDPTLRANVVPCPTNDTWARDHAFITLLSDDDRSATLLDYQFNGWGLKFPAHLDNQINARILPHLPSRRHYQSCLDFVLEGGSIESDGKGTILTTASCLLAPNRNNLPAPQIEQRLLSDLHAQRILWLHHGHLQGDDTDGHIDTLARFCPDDTIAYVQSTDPTDPQHADLKHMEAELQTFRTTDGRPYRLIPLPMPDAICDGDQRLPATYANFLIINGAVLCPTYRQPPHDHQAMHQLQLAFPHHEIVPIDSTPLIRQHGSLHCSAMQYPALADER